MWSLRVGGAPSPAAAPPESACSGGGCRAGGANRTGRPAAGRRTRCGPAPAEPPASTSAPDWRRPTEPEQNPLKRQTANQLAASWIRQSDGPACAALIPASWGALEAVCSLDIIYVDASLDAVSSEADLPRGRPSWIRPQFRKLLYRKRKRLRSHLHIINILYMSNIMRLKNKCSHIQK